MSERKTIKGAALRAAAILLAAIVFSTVPTSGIFAATHKGSGGSSSASEYEATSPQIAEFMALLADPKVRDWLEKQGAVEASHSKPAPEAESVSQYVDGRIGAIRGHFVALGSALPDLPNEFERAYSVLQADIPRRGTVVVLVLFFAALGFGVEWLFRKATQKTRERLVSLPMETVRDRLLLVAARFAFSFVAVVAFALGSVGPFFAFDWPPLLRQMLLGYLVAVLVTRIAVVVGQFLLAPNDERFRIVPTDSVAARFWCRRLTAFVGWLAFGWVTLSLLSALGFSLEERHLVAYVLGLGLLAIAGIPVAPAGGAGSGNRSAGTPEAASRPGRTERAIVGRHSAVVGALASGSHAGLLVRSGHRHPAAGQRRDSAHGRAPA